MLTIVLLLALWLQAPPSVEAHQLVSANQTSTSASPSPAAADGDFSADDDMVLVLGYAAAVALGLGGLALLDRRPPVEMHDAPDDPSFDDDEMDHA